MAEGSVPKLEACRLLLDLLEIRQARSSGLTAKWYDRSLPFVKNVVGEGSAPYTHKVLFKSTSLATFFKVTSCLPFGLGTIALILTSVG